MTPSQRVPLLVFTIEDQHFALHLQSVQRAVRAVEVTPLPGAPEIVLGVINVSGRIIPVADTRMRLGLARREIRVDDAFILAHTGRLAIALIADSVEGLVELATETVTGAEKIVPGLELVEGIAKLETGLVLIEDLGKFFSLDESIAIEEALKT